MKLSLYQQVALKRDLPEHGLKRGDVATLVDSVPHPYGGEEGGILEVFNALGESIAVITVPESAIEGLHAERDPVCSAPCEGRLSVDGHQRKVPVSS